MYGSLKLRKSQMVLNLLYNRFIYFLILCSYVYVYVYVSVVHNCQWLGWAYWTDSFEKAAQDNPDVVGYVPVWLPVEVPSFM